jgi:hypothetical protein
LSRDDQHGIAEMLQSEIRSYVGLRGEAEELERLAKEARQRADEQKMRVWDMLESSGVKTINHELGRITRSVRHIAIVEDREALAQWLDDKGLSEAFTKVDFRQAQLNGLVKEVLEEGGEFPEGVDTLAIKTITYTPKR